MSYPRDQYGRSYYDRPAREPHHRPNQGTTSYEARYHHKPDYDPAYLSDGEGNPGQHRGSITKKVKTWESKIPFGQAPAPNVRRSKTFYPDEGPGPRDSISHIPPGNAQWDRAQTRLYGAPVVNRDRTGFVRPEEIRMQERNWREYGDRMTTHRLTILTLKYVKHALESSSPPLMAALETTWLMSKNGNGWLKCLKDTLARQLHLKWDISSLDTIKKHINENIALAQKIAFKKLDDEYKALSKTSRLRAITRYGQKGELKKYGYMETLLPYGRALAKIRISAHRLAVERRRYIARVDRTERWCTKCKAKDIHAIEDERHIVFDCEEFTEVRTALWKKMDMNKGIKEYREGYVRLRLKEEGASVVTWLSPAWKVKLLKLFIDPLDKSEALLVGRYWAKALKRIDQRYIN
ncbi:hypothetical protein BJ508DRAFT_331303 [Ascobolus immersus RN42]|uniref:Uncharacterized protein n=1 Tax=Ascobolus immersus RN42 TaxID=1160509 RepID=A0A3N4HUM2_ASCIM|nr:hypothetical protein BJ508DRAFT_331303 [Ascobolus immersus RN42]